MTEAETERAHVVAFIEKEGGEIAHDMAHHVGDQIYEVLKRNGLAMRSEAAATSMLVLASVQTLMQAIDQCSRAAEEDCTAPVVTLFLNSLPDALRDHLPQENPK